MANTPSKSKSKGFTLIVPSYPDNVRNYSVLAGYNCPEWSYKCPGLVPSCTRTIIPGDYFYEIARAAGRLKGKDSNNCACQIQACNNVLGNLLYVGQIINLPPCACATLHPCNICPNQGYGS